MKPAGELTGVRIADKYELLRLIGRGGMGAVYEARNVATLKRCAVKVLLTPELAGDAEVVKRFFREARASGVIESEHVVAAFDSGIDAAEHVYYVMECLQGEDLEQALRRTGPLNPDAAAKIALQAATGLTSAHALGIVHRDVKPANLFLATAPNDEIKVKILDFGVAKVKMELFNESTHSLTHSGSVLGTPLYMSPEQLRRASDIDESADVWSLGVVLFECLTGRLPWGKVEGIGELVAAILTSEVPHLQDLAPWVRPELAEVVHRALSRDPDHRLRTAAELRDALRRLVDSPRLLKEEIGGPAETLRSSQAPRLSLADTVMIGRTPRFGVPAIGSTSSTPPPVPTRTRPLSLFLGLAALVGAGVWVVAQRSPERSTQSTPTAAQPTPPPSAPPPPPVSSPPRATKQFALEVGPPGVVVSVDGVPVPVTNGRVRIEGAVGSVPKVELTLNGRSTEQRVAITTEGLVPGSVAIQAPKRVVGPVVGTPGHSQSKREPGPTKVAPPVPSVSGGFSPVFE